MAEDTKESPWETRYSLLDRVKDPNDQESWKEFVSHYEQFVSHYEQYVYSILRHFRLSVADTEELCQDIMLKLWKVMPEFRLDKDRGKFRQWLRTVIANEARGFLRKQSRREELMDEQDAYLVDTLHGEGSETKLDGIIAEEWEDYVSKLAWDHVKILPYGFKM